MLPVSSYLSIPGTPVSLDRIFFFLLLVFLGLNSKNIVIDRMSLLLIFTSIVMSCLAILSFVLNERSNSSTLFAYLYFIAYFVIAFFVFSYRPSAYTRVRYSQLMNTVTSIWLVIAVIFSLWALYNQLYLGQLIYPTYLEVSPETEVRFRSMMSGLRLFLPFSSAPFLGFLTLGVAFLTIFNRKYYIRNNALNLLILFSCIIIALATQSRSVIYAFALAIGLFFVIKNLNLNDRQSVLKLTLLAVPFLVFIVAIAASQSTELGRLQFDYKELQESRHMLIRLETIELIILSDIKALFIGHGLGALAGSGIAPYTFTSYLTVLYEVGILGFVFYLIILISPLIAVISRKKASSKRGQYSKLEVLSLFLFIFIANLFYEFKLFPVAAILLAYNVAMATRSQVKG